MRVRSVVQSFTTSWRTSAYELVTQEPDSKLTHQCQRARCPGGRGPCLPFGDARNAPARGRSQDSIPPGQRDVFYACNPTRKPSILQYSFKDTEVTSRDLSLGRETDLMNRRTHAPRLPLSCTPFPHASVCTEQQSGTPELQVKRGFLEV